MEFVLPVVALLAVLFLVSRGLPLGRWPLVIAGTLAAIVLVVMAERAGLWPAGFRVN